MNELQVAELPAQPRKKKIVICCDGTGNEFGAPNPNPNDKNAGQNSNVVKLYTALQIDSHQVGYYHPGVGTMGAPNANGRLSRWWSQVKGLAFGAGFRDNVIDAYRYLMEVYNDNGGDGNEDEIYIFGFSRGAYTARALAGFLYGYGLLCKGNEGHIPYAWRMYVAQHEDRSKNKVEPDLAFKATFSHEHFKIQFMGVWDTVSSIGWISSPLRLFNLTENSIIVRGRHAVSIDEHRCFFQDNLWQPLNGQDLVQVWFAGVHSDVGGSYLQPETGLSAITFLWMLNEVGYYSADTENAHARGLRVNQARLDLVLGKNPTAAQDPLFYQPYTLSKLHNSLRWAWWLLEVIPHLYFDNDDKKERRRVPLGFRRRKLPGGSLVHKSVVERMKDAEFRYKPKNVSRAELTQSGGDSAPVSADGSRYYRFTPDSGRRSSWFLGFFDRFVVTWLFGIVDVVVLLPSLISIVLMITATALAFVGKAVVLCWHFIMQRVPWLVHAIAYWPSHLCTWLLAYLRQLWHLFV